MIDSSFQNLDRLSVIPKRKAEIAETALKFLQVDLFVGLNS